MNHKINDELYNDTIIENFDKNKVDFYEFKN